MKCLLLRLILFICGLEVCGWTTGAGKAALSQQGHSNGTAACEQEETEEDTGNGCPRLTSVHYCIRNRRALFIFNGSEQYLAIPVQFEADGIPIITSQYLNSSAGKLTVDMDEVMGGGNFTFKLSLPYTQCNHIQYCGRYETGLLYMDNGIKVENDNDTGCKPEDGMLSGAVTNTFSVWGTVLGPVIVAYLLSWCLGTSQERM